MLKAASNARVDDRADAIVIVAVNSAANGLLTAAQSQGWRVLRGPEPADVLKELFRLNPAVTLVEVSSESSASRELVQTLCEHARRPQVVAILVDQQPHWRQNLERQLRSLGACCCVNAEIDSQSVTELVNSLLKTQQRKASETKQPTLCRVMLN